MRAIEAAAMHRMLCNRFAQFLVQAPAGTAGVDVEYIKALAYDQNEEIIILDFERLFFNGS